MSVGNTGGDLYIYLQFITDSGYNYRFQICNTIVIKYLLFTVITAII